MINYSSEAIKARLIQNLQNKTSSANILPFGTNARLIDVIAEGLSELARYDAYLTRENKWELAQNRTSLATQAKILSYNSKRRISAFGSVRVAINENAIDLSAVRTWQFSGFYNSGMRVGYSNRVYECLNDGVQYDETLDAGKNPLNDTLNWVRVSGLANSVDIVFPQFTEFSNGDELVFSSLYADETFNAGDDYAEVTVVQGVYVPFVQQAQGASFEKIVIDDDSIAESHVWVRVNGNEYTILSDIRLAEESELAVEMENLPDGTGVAFTFGNGVFGRKLQSEDTVSIDYISTKGASGNVLAINTIAEVVSAITNAQGQPVDLFVANEQAVAGGRGAETIEEIRTNAPRLFQTGGRATSAQDYETILQTEFEFISRAVAWGAYERNVDAGRHPTAFIPTEDNLVYLSAFASGGVALTDSQRTQIIIRLNALKAPTDLIRFEDSEVVGLRFFGTAGVRNRAFPLSRVELNIRTALEQEYSIDNVNYGQNLYYSDYIRFLDSVDGVDHHNTHVEFTNTYPLVVAYETGFKNMAIAPVDLSTVTVWLNNRLNSDPAVQIGRFSANTILGMNGYNLIGSSIAQTGKVRIVISSGWNEGYFDDYDIEVRGQSTAENYLLSQRNQIFNYVGSDIVCSYIAT